MRNRTVLFLLILLAGQGYGESFSFKGVKREYFPYIPKAYVKGRAASLVLILHGGSGGARYMVSFTGLGPYAERDTAILVAPAAFRRRWNDGRFIVKNPKTGEEDDVGFLSALIESLCAKYTIDRKRIFVTGASNGGMMCFRLACELSDKIAAVGPVIASMPENLESSCKPGKPVSLLMMNGTTDPLVPYEGGEVRFGKRKLGRVLSTRASMEFWVNRDQCRKDGARASLPDTDPKDGTTTEKVVYSGGQEGTEVVLYTVRGGGHTWPGGIQYAPELLIGKTASDFSASEVIWEFFKSHPRP
jgi:polyhydroxybutyrate depolymerase